MLPRIYIGKEPKKDDYLVYDINDIDINKIIKYKHKNKKILVVIKDNIKYDILLKVLEEIPDNLQLDLYFEKHVDLPETIKSRAIVQIKEKRIDLVRDEVNINKLGKYYSWLLKNDVSEYMGYVIRVAKWLYYKEKGEALNINLIYGYVFVFMYIFLKIGVRVDVDIYKCEDGFHRQNSIVDENWIKKKLEYYTGWDLVFYLQKKLCYVNSSKVYYKLTEMFDLFSSVDFRVDYDGRKFLFRLAEYLKEKNKNNLILRGNNESSLYR